MANLVQIENKIFMIRGHKVMLDRDLAGMYGVETFVLNQSVKRNKERFPDDFMFSLSRREILNISQNVICSSIKHSKNVNAFTEQGIAMLSGVLRSKRAVQVNIAIMRAFVKLRKILSTHKELSEKLRQLEKRMDGQDQKNKAIFDAIRQLMSPELKPSKKIGFLRDG